MTTLLGGQEAPSTSEPRESFFDRPRATGDWGGARNRLEEWGVEIDASYVLESNAAWSGGLSSRESSRNQLTANVLVDMERAVGWSGLSLFAQYLSVNAERGGTTDVGDLQVYSNIESDRSLDVISELWLEQQLLGDRFRLKIGKIEANSEFAVPEIAGEFSNSSAGFSPTIVGFPSYPDPATGVCLFIRPLEDLTLAYGWFDGALGADGVPTGRLGPSTFLSDDRSGDYFHIGELRVEWTDARERSGRLALGGWYHDGDFVRFDGATESETAGVHLVLEQHLRTLGYGGELHAFLQYGWADGNVIEFENHLGLGVVLAGIGHARPSDSLGVYVSFVDLSDEPDAGFRRDEVVIDTYYRLQLTPFFFVQPELQVIFDPAGDPAIDDAFVAGLRLGIDF